jgi:hypothetical protein
MYHANLYQFSVSVYAKTITVYPHLHRFTAADSKYIFIHSIGIISFKILESHPSFWPHVQEGIIVSPSTPQARSIYNLNHASLHSTATPPLQISTPHPPQNSNNQPPLPPRRILHAPIRQPLALQTHRIALPDPLDLQAHAPQRGCVEEACHLRAPGVEAGYDPGAPVRSQKPRYRALEVIVLRGHPEAVGYEDAGEGVCVGEGEVLA